jgi:quercetin dioxygenase-like cupin family protein
MTRRRDFLTCSAAVTGALVLPDFGFGQKSADSKTEARMVPGNEGKKVWMTGIMVTIKADSHMTAGAYAVFEDLVLPGQGMRLHVHTREDETLYVLEGELQVVLGDQTYSARVGDFAHMARGIPHRFQNISDKPARMVLSYSPGGFEQFFLDVGKPVTDPEAAPPEVTPQDIRKAREVAQMYGVMAI